MRIPRQFLQDAATVFILFMATGAFQSLVLDSSDPQATTNGSPMMWVFWSLLYSIIVMRLIPKYREVAALVRANKFLFGLVALTILSAVWSIEPGFSLRHGIALVATSLVGLDFAIRYSIREQLRLLYIALCVFVVLSIGAQVIFPGLIPSLDYGDEAWHGVLSFKNAWARVIVLAVVAMLCHSRRSRSDSLLVGGLLLLAAALVILANSKGSLIVMAAMLVFSRISGALHWNRKLLTIGFVLVVVVAIPLAYLVFQNLDNLTSMLGRDATLTGRSTLWEMTFSSIAKSPVFGYGYLAFWTASSQEAMRIRSELNWDAPHAHNGYIDVALGIGLLGLFSYLAAYATALGRAVKRFRADCEPEAMWPLAYLVFTLMSQLTESSIVAGNSIFWILYVAVACSVTAPQHAYSAVLNRNTEAEASDTDLDAVGDYA
jgi:exopolysaccharide production protein ExoQ